MCCDHRTEDSSTFAMAKPPLSTAGRKANKKGSGYSRKTTPPEGGDDPRDQDTEQNKSSNSSSSSEDEEEKEEALKEAPVVRKVNLDDQEVDNRSGLEVTINLDSDRQDVVAGNTSDGTAPVNDSTGTVPPGGGGGGGGGGASATAGTSRPPKIVRLVGEEFDIYTWLLTLDFSKRATYQAVTTQGLMSICTILCYRKDETVDNLCSVIRKPGGASSGNSVSPRLAQDLLKLGIWAAVIGKS